jgi:hypothetical protein
MHLSNAQVDFMDVLQRRAIYEGGIAFVSIVTVPQLLLLYAYARDTKSRRRRSSSRRGRIR